MEKSVGNKMLSSTKWSTMGEVFAKLVSPITNMILARILLPDDFGIVATITMIISFADMFTDAGFQKYIIQADIEKKNLGQYANVAFWTNLLVSVVLWLILFFSRFKLSIILGNPELKNILPYATISIILSSLSMIQIGLFRRDFDFKKLFLVRLVGLFIPLIITVPFAFLGFKFWAIIIGNIVLAIVNAVLLTLMSPWKPSLFYDFQILKRMFSFSIWTLIEGITMWMTSWFDSFLISNRMNKRNLGIYKTSITSTNGIINLITGSTTPVLFSGLSRLKNNENEFWDIFFNMQRVVALFVIPLGMGMFVFQDLITRILLGKGWEDAAIIIGNWALASSFKIIFGNFFTEVFRAKGKPKLAVFAQILHLVFLIPVIIWSINISFTVLVIARSWSMLQFILISIFIMKREFDINIKKMLLNLKYIFLSSFVMASVGLLGVRLSESLIVQLIMVLLCIIIYFSIMFSFSESRKDLLKFFKMLKK